MIGWRAIAGLWQTIKNWKWFNDCSSDYDFPHAILNDLNVRKDVGYVRNVKKLARAAYLFLFEWRWLTKSIPIDDPRCLPTWSSLAGFVATWHTWPWRCSTVLKPRPIIVFDGERLPAKAKEEKRRGEVREAARLQALELLQRKHHGEDVDEREVNNKWLGHCAVALWRLNDGSRLELYSYSYMAYDILICVLYLHLSKIYILERIQ